MNRAHTLPLAAKIFCLLTVFNFLSLQAEPRSPIPPWPEPHLFLWRFDDAAQQSPSFNATQPEQSGLAESWSGYSLTAAGAQASNLQVPSFDSTGRQYLSRETGSVRFWFKPEWSSTSAGGSGPSQTAKLFEMSAGNFGVVLSAGSDGNSLSVMQWIGPQTATPLQTTVEWSADQWHQIALVYSPTGTELFVDGNLAAEGSAITGWPSPTTWESAFASIGNGLDGNSPAQGELDEIATFADLLAPEYIDWHYHYQASLAALGPVTEQELIVKQLQKDFGDDGGMMMLMGEDDPPEPPGGGGGSGDELPTSSPLPPGLKLTRPIFQGNNILLSLYEVDTNHFYDVFQKVALSNTVPWTHVASGAWGETNFTIPKPATNSAFYIAANAYDSDGDDLSDAMEHLVTGTDPNDTDSDNDGISDAFEDYDGNGIPDYADVEGKTKAVVWASRPTAYEGGVTGEFTVQLPQPAPAGGATLEYHLWGNATRPEHYTISPTANPVVIPAGQTTFKFTVTAVNDTLGEDEPREVEFRLLQAGTMLIDGTLAKVALVDNDPVPVRVIAEQSFAKEGPTGAFRDGLFYFTRAKTNGTLTVNYNLTGSTAVNGTDFTTLPFSITFTAGEDSKSLTLHPLNDTNAEPVEYVSLNLVASANYSQDTNFNKAVIAIEDDDLPLVQILPVDVDMDEQSPNTTGQFRVTRVGPTNEALFVDVRYYGTAQEVMDFTRTTNQVWIAAGSTNTLVTLTSVNDTNSETLEFVTATIESDMKYRVGTNNAVTLWINDNDPLDVEWSIDKNAASHWISGTITKVTNDYPAEITITRKGDVRQAAQIGFKYVGLTNHFLLTGDINLATKMVLFKTNSPVAKFQVRSRFTNGTSGFHFQLSNYYGGLELPVSLIPPWNIVTMSVITNLAVEGTTQHAKLRFTRLFTTNQGTTVSLMLGGTATSGDHNLPTGVVIPSGQSFVETTIVAANDGITEGWETLTVRLQTNSTAFVPVTTTNFHAVILLREANTTNTMPFIDTDEDGLDDNFEIASGLNPNVANPNWVDNDKDGVVAWKEQAHGSRDNARDSNSNGYEDGTDWRMQVYGASSPEDLKNMYSLGEMLDLGINSAHPVIFSGGDYTQQDQENSGGWGLDYAQGKAYTLRISPIGTVTGSPTYDAWVHTYTTPTPAVIDDPNNILGNGRPLNNTTSNLTATLCVPGFKLGVDLNRDVKISFGLEDLTEEGKPYEFWINDDFDFGSNDQAEDRDPNTGANGANGYIDNLRDLEDLAPFHLKMDGIPFRQLKNGDVELSLVFMTTNGAAMRLYRSADTNYGGLSYLTNNLIATNQLKSPFTNQLVYFNTSSNRYTFSSNYWSNLSTNYSTNYMLFEGVATGDVKIYAVLKDKFQTNVVVVSDPIYLKLRKVTDMFEHFTIGDNTSTLWNQVLNKWEYTSDSGRYSTNSNTSTNDYIVFVHGWRMRPWERRAFAHTAFKRLWWVGYQGRFGAFTWPTEYVDVIEDPFSCGGIPEETQNYTRSERIAWWSGEGLRSLLLRLNRQYPGKVRVVAHSMGNVVASEALLRQARKNGKPIAHTYVASQSATVAHAYDPVGPEDIQLITETPEVYASNPYFETNYFNGLKRAVFTDGAGVARVINYHNPADCALGGWEFGQDTKPDIGWTYSHIMDRWYRGNTASFGTRLDFPADTYEIYAHIAEARSRALGAAVQNGHSVAGEITVNVNLNGNPFFYGNGGHEHSAQFRSTAMRRYTYWQQLLVSFELD